MHLDDVQLRPRSAGAFAALAALAALTMGAACTPERGDSGSDATTVESTLAIPEVTEPPERATPFCQIMLELDASLPDDQTIDVTDIVLVAYREALPVAPPEIATELEAVIIGLETGTEPTLPPTTLGPAPGSSDATTDLATGTTDADGVGSPSDTAADPPSPETFVPPPAGTAPASTLEPPTPEEAFTEEGYTPADDPAIRLNEYVDFACRDNINNPGPPPTQPSATPVPTVDGE